MTAKELMTAAIDRFGVIGRSYEYWDEAHIVLVRETESGEYRLLAKVRDDAGFAGFSIAFANI